MNSPIQLKINLTPELRELLRSKASKFGVPLMQYVKHVLMKDVDNAYPIYEVSEETKQVIRDARQSSRRDRFFQIASQ